jgi:putative membrane protein
MKWLLSWLLHAAALLLIAHLIPGVEVVSYAAALWTALLLTVFNTILRPVLILLTLPVTVLSLGLFIFVINAALFYAAAELLDGFKVAGYWAAFLGSAVYGVVGAVLDTALEQVQRGPAER